MASSYGTGIQSTAELSYAPAAPSRRRRRRAIRRTVLAVLLLGAAACFWRWHEPLLAHGRVLYWQRKCQTHTFAPDAVVAYTIGQDSFAIAPATAAG
jgi:ferric-dicitrate binding protein FerR (iron transport regulator)